MKETEVRQRAFAMPLTARPFRPAPTVSSIANIW